MVRNRPFLIFFFLMLEAVSCRAATLDMEPMALFKCWRALKSLNTPQTPVVPKSFSQNSNETLSSTPLFSQLNSSHLAVYFQKGMSGPIELGGLVYRTVDGSLKVLYWPIQKRLGASGKGHREAIAEILGKELKAVEHYLSNPKNEKLPFLLDVKANHTDLLSEFKKNPEIPEESSGRFFGFLVQAEKKGDSSDFKVKSIDFDLRLVGEDKMRSSFSLIEEVQGILNEISKSVSPKLRPEVYRLSPSLLESYLGPSALKAPAGSRFIKLE